MTYEDNLNYLKDIIDGVDVDSKVRTAVGIWAVRNLEMLFKLLVSADTTTASSLDDMLLRDRLESLGFDLKDAALSISSEENYFGKWVSCKDHLPEPGVECLCMDADGEMGVGFYREDAHGWDSCNWGWLERKGLVANKTAYSMPCGIGKVVKWMPLPVDRKELIND